MKQSASYWIFVRIPVWFVVLSLAAVVLLRWVPVRYTPLMLKRAFQFRDVENFHTEQEWVSLEYISPELIKAVLAGEDTRFYEHHGFDWYEIHAVLRTHRQDGAKLRGCSTISQQTAKNVFTFGSHTWIRKSFEAWWTVLIEFIWGKDRIQEVYLNVVELGPGVYGVGAASKAYFHHPAGKLSASDAATLAACLSSPLVDQPGNLSASAKNKKRIIIERMQQVSLPAGSKQQAVWKYN